MNLEIERKFLVHGDAWRHAAEPVYFCQGYLNPDKHRTVRVRVAGPSAQLTVKGISTHASRSEFEYEIPVDDAKQLLELCDRPLIEKHRSRVPFDDLVWEIDEFLGENKGLILAEVELAREDQAIALPDWAGKEVTGDPAYFNSSLVSRPYRSWN